MSVQQDGDGTANAAAEWDKEDVYDEQIAPLMTKIIEICKAHQIPIVATFQFNGAGDRCTTTIGDSERASEDMMRFATMMQPRTGGIALAVTEATDQDGKRKISIRRL